MSAMMQKAQAAAIAAAAAAATASQQQTSPKAGSHGSSDKFSQLCVYCNQVNSTHNKHCSCYGTPNIISNYLFNFWWFVRVTLVIAFGFLPQNFGRWWGPMNGPLSFYECRFSGGDTMRWWGHSNPTLCKRICLNFLHSQVVWTPKREVFVSLPGETFTNFVFFSFHRHSKQNLNWRSTWSLMLPLATRSVTFVMRSSHRPPSSQNTN